MTQQTLQNIKGTKTSTRNIAIDYDGITIYISEPLKYGNSKLSKTIGIFDLPMIESCKNCESCKWTCYARVAQFQYPDVYTMRALHFYLAEKQPEVLKQLIVDQLKHADIKVLRIHSSGEFFSQAYIQMWSEIIAMFPHISFYTYSKMTDILDFTPLFNLENFNLVRSILPNGEKNYGSKAFIIAASKKFKAKICPYGLTKEVPHCGDTCKACINNENVVFLQH